VKGRQGTERNKKEGKLEIGGLLLRDACGKGRERERRREGKKEKEMRG